MYLDGHKNLHANAFYVRWILKNYRLQDVLATIQPITKLFVVLIRNISEIDGSEKLIVEILNEASSTQAVFENVMGLFLKTIQDSKKIEKLCEAYAEFSKELSENQASKFERLLIETPGAMPIAIQLFAGKISSAKSPVDEFWSLYDHHKSRMHSDSGFSIDPMALACLTNVDPNHRQDVSVEMIRRIDPSLFHDSRTIKILTDCINDCNLKSMSKLDSTVLERAQKLRGKINGDGGMEKIKAMMMAQKIDACYSMGRRLTDLSTELTNKDISLVNFDKADYESYIKNYLIAYFSLVNSKEDVALLMKVFYHRQYFADFVSDYISLVKKMERKEQERWMKVLVWTCVYLISAPIEDQSAEGLYKPMVHYMRSLDDETLANAKEEIAKDAPRARCDQMFEEINRKEGFSEKFNSFFRRK